MAYDIRSATNRPDNIGGGVAYEFWLGTAEDKKELPKPGEWAANTSVAWVKSTDEIGTLGDDGWTWM